MGQRSTSIGVRAQVAGRVARAVGVLGAALALPVAPISALAQVSPDGMITIPGNGEAPATQAQGSNAAPAQRAPAQSANADAQFQAAARGAQIVIPGAGEAGAKPTGVTIETVQGTAQGPGVTPGAHATRVAFPTRPVSTSINTQNANAANAAVANPGLNPAVAALLANPAGSRSAGLDSNPRLPAGGDLARLQAQAANELSRDGRNASGTTNLSAAAAQASQTAGATGRPSGAMAAPAKAALAAEAGGNVANAGTAAGANAPMSTGTNAAGNKALKFSATHNIPTAKSMPALDTIAPSQSLGSAMSPAARFAAAQSAAQRQAKASSQLTDDGANASVNSSAAGANGATAAQTQTPGATAGNVQAGAQADAAGNAQAGATPESGLRAAHAPLQIVVASSDGPPIAHSVTIQQMPAPAAQELPGKQDPAAVMKTAEDFLRQQATGLPGHVTITVPPITPRGLAACDNLQAFMAPGAPVWGRTTVGVRCAGEKPWTIYVMARISVQATYYVASREILAGDVIQATDLLPRDGDLAVMPRAIVTDPSQAVGAVAQNRITPGVPVRTDLIRSVNAIQLGQTVKVVAQGDGFSISTDGSAMNNASPGQQVRVKTENGQTVVGTASGRGVVEIPM